VSNTSEGHVEGEALGEKGNVGNLYVRSLGHRNKLTTGGLNGQTKPSVGMLHQGPSMANVSAVDISNDLEINEKDAESAGFSGKFDVRR
jgi:hypothetical protein